jgi:hypothetical protein
MTKSEKIKMRLLKIITALSALRPIPPDRADLAETALFRRTGFCSIETLFFICQEEMIKRGYLPVLVQ